MSSHHPRMSLQQTGLLVTGVLVYVGAAVAALSGELALDVDIVYLIAGGPVFATVGIVILLNRPGHRLGRLLLAVGVGLTIATAGPVVMEALVPLRWTIRPIRGLLESIVEWSGTIAILCGTVLVLVWFPDGRATSRLGRAIELASLLFLGVAILSSLGLDLEFISPWSIVLAFGLYVASVIELAVRTRSAEPRMRASMQLVLGSAVVMVLGIAGVVFVGELVPVVWSLWIGATLLPAIAVAVAISRHHLYDIDRLVSRTIAYTIVTVILVTVSGGLLLGLQAVMTEVADGETIIVAASTLVAVALFAPLRSRVQVAVDRRFDRDGYDAERTVEAYAGRLRDELDLATLTSDLRAVTTRTVHPTVAGVWLRTDRRVPRLP